MESSGWNYGFECFFLLKCHQGKLFINARANIVRARSQSEKLKAIFLINRFELLHMNVFPIKIPREKAFFTNARVDSARA